MRIKKAIAVLLAVIVLALPLAVVSFAAPAIISGPDKTAYTDLEKFDPHGIVISDGEKEIAYSAAEEKFSFVPGLNELLTVNEMGETKVDVYYDNRYVGSVMVTVDHVLGDVVSLGDAGHGQYCLGCGTVHNFEEHDIPEFIPNDDGGLIIQQTQTGKCTVCEAEITENIPGSEKFLSIFGGEMTELEGTIIGYVYTILVSLIQALAGIA